MSTYNNAILSVMKILDVFPALLIIILPIMVLVLIVIIKFIPSSPVTHIIIASRVVSNIGVI